MFKRGKQPQRPPVAFDDDGVRRTLPDGRTESVSWTDLAEVRILTTSDGPAAEDVFFVLAGADLKSGCVIAQGDLPDGLLDRLFSLPGFDHNKVSEAMGTATEAQFLLLATTGIAKRRHRRRNLWAPRTTAHTFTQTCALLRGGCWS